MISQQPTFSILTACPQTHRGPVLTSPDLHLGKLSVPVVPADSSVCALKFGSSRTRRYQTALEMFPPYKLLVLPAHRQSLRCVHGPPFAEGQTAPHNLFFWASGLPQEAEKTCHGKGLRPSGMGHPCNPATNLQSPQYQPHE